MGVKIGMRSVDSGRIRFLATGRPGDAGDGAEGREIERAGRSAQNSDWGAKDGRVSGSFWPLSGRRIIIIVKSWARKRASIYAPRTKS